MRKSRVAALAAIVVASAAALSLSLTASIPADTPAHPPPDEGVPLPDPAQLPTLVLSPAGDAPAQHLAVDASPPANYESSVNEFAFDLYRVVSADEKEAGKNLFFSPISIHTAFSVLYEGARGNTA